MATVQIVFRKDKVNKRKEAPIHIRITKSRKVSYLATGIMIPIIGWDEKKMKVKSNQPNSARLNSFIYSKFSEVQEVVLKNETLSNSLSSRGLKERIFGKKEVDFYEYAEIVTEKYKQNGKIGSYNKNRAILAKLKAFTSFKAVSFTDITLNFLDKYEHYLKVKLSNKTNTIHKDMKFLRKIFNDAVRDDLINQDINPFRKYKMKIAKTHREHLNEDELKRMEGFLFEHGSRLELHRDMFIFSSYVGGLRISDVLKMKCKDFDGVHLNLVVKKTDTQLSIKVPGKGLKILERYIEEGNDPDSFIFPMLPTGTNLSSPLILNQAISRCTAYINKNLKIIANSVGINKNLSFHISRHSFAVLALRKGISIDKLSRLMAHSAIRETQVYAKIGSEELDKAMDVLDF